MRDNEHLDELEKYANWISDMDFQWWPFLFLRPRPEQRLGTLRVALIAVLYGVFVGVLGNVLLALYGRTFDPWAFPLAAVAALFVFNRLTFAFFWNRRAARLVQQGVNRGRWGQR